MPSPRLPVLWICGASGAGKSVTAWSLFEGVAGEGTPVAYVDIDQLGMLYPETQADPGRFRLKTQVLEALIPHHLAHGARALIVSGVVDPATPAGGAIQRPDARVTFCLLDTAEETLRERILERGWGPEAADEAVAEATALREAAFLDAVIDTAGATVRTVTDRVRPLLSPLEVVVPDADRRPETSTASAPLLLVTGARAVGTSTVGFALARSQWTSGVVTGFADLDQLAFVRDVERDGRGSSALGAANLAALHEVFASHGAERVIVSAHLRDTSEHDLVRSAVPRAAVTIVRLTADDETITAHVRERTAGSEARLAGDDLVGASPKHQEDVVRQARARGACLDAHADEDVLVDVSGRPVDAVVAELVDALLP